MKQYKVKQVEAKELIGLICDRCGADIPLPDVSRETRDFSLEFSHGKTLGPDGGGFVDGWVVEDLCDPCTEFLRKLLLDNGFDVLDKHADF